MSRWPLEEIETLEMEEVGDEEEEVEYEEVSEYEEVTEDEESERQPKEQPQLQNPNPNNNAHLQSEGGEEEVEEVEYEEVSEYEEEESVPQPKEQPQPQIPNPNNNPKLSIPEPIAHLQSLYTALSSFLHKYSSLYQTLDSINTSILQTTPLNIELTDLKLICQLSASKPLRKYIYAHLSDPDRLSHDVPEALKLSPDPASLVLESMANFYTRGRKAYEHGDLQAIEVRRVSILLLEFYMIAGCPVGDDLVGSKKVMDTAKKVATVWRGRLVREGGVDAACVEDSLGLVLLVGGFGVPQEFTTMDLYHLLKLSNLKKKGDILCRSRILVEKMPDIIRDLISKEMHVEAVDLIYAFGLEEKFPPVPLLSSFVEKTCEVGSEERRGQCSTRSLNEATEKQLAMLKSVLKCVEVHNIEASELSNLRITQKIAMCKKEILKFERKLQENSVKRKAEDVRPQKNQYNQSKQLRPFSAEASHGPFTQSIRPTQEQGVTGITDSRCAYIGGSIASNMPVSTEVSLGLVDRNNVGFLRRNVYDSTDGWHPNAAYENSSGQSLLGTLYPSGHDYSRSLAATGQNQYQSTVAGQNHYQAAVAGKNHYQAAVAGQNYYQPAVAGQNHYQPAVAGQNYYQPTVAGQNYFQALSSSVVTGRNLYQFVDTIAEKKLPNYIIATSTALPTTATTTTNPSHQSSYTG